MMMKTKTQEEKVELVLAGEWINLIRGKKEENKKLMDKKNRKIEK